LDAFAKEIDMPSSHRKSLPLSRLAWAGPQVLAACIIGTDEPPTLAGHFGDRLEGLSREHRLDSSLKALELMKAKTGGDYRYRRGFASWTGSSGETWIRVDDGVVIRREYSSRHLDSAGRTVAGPAYVEEGPDVGSHGEGHPAVTLDSLYRLCRESLRADTATHWVGLHLDHNYILSGCGNVPKGVVDNFGGLQVGLDEVRWD
jgi:hypothetical protein